MIKHRIVAVANQKGGVGKTTTTLNLATAIAATKKRVLIVDFDPQGNASTGLGIPLRDRTLTSYDILFSPEIGPHACLSTLVPCLDLIAATPDLAAVEVELVSKPNRTERLKKALNNIKGYDYIFIDCPPSLGLLTINALACAQRVLVPLQCEFYALEGLSHLLTNVKRIQENLNPQLELEGIVLTMYDRRSLLNKQVAEDAQAHLGSKVYRTMVPRNVRVSEAPSYGKPVMLHDFRCSGSQAYVNLAQEFIEREARV
jgi:chromosome partitioning protein